MSRAGDILESLRNEPGTYDGSNGLFAYVVPSNPEKLLYEYSKFSSYISFVPLDEMHVTIMYSKDPLNQPFISPVPDLIYANPVKLEYWSGHDAVGYLVLKLESDLLTVYNTEFRNLGASPPTYNEYNPHITLAKGFDLTTPLEDLISEYNKVITTKSPLILKKFTVNNL